MGKREARGALAPSRVGGACSKEGTAHLILNFRSKKRLKEAR